MKYRQTFTSAFTLIELIITLTIFSMIMVSVMSIFILSSQMSAKIEITRVMQENIKISFEDISESVRKNDITDVTNVGYICGSSLNTGTGTKLCIGENGITQIEYFLANKVSNMWTAITNVDDCKDTTEDEDSVCRIVKREGGVIVPLTNNLVSFESLEFNVQNTYIPRVTILATIRPSYRAGITPDIVELSTMHLQTTLSERTIISK